MENNNRISVFEHKRLYIQEDEVIGGFHQKHFDLLMKYHGSLKSCPFFTPSYKHIKFNQFVGVLKVGNLTIEVLPKIDGYDNDSKDKEQNLWRSVLLKMLFRSLQVEAKITTSAALHMRTHSVLETYLHWFLEEVTKLVHQGLIKKYRTTELNTTALKGKLLVHKQITHNAVHQERFYVAQSVYNFDNAYNAILRQALETICLLYKGTSLGQSAQALLLDFPECSKVKITEGLFAKLKYDRKTTSYRQAIELAKVILLNCHPDVRGGTNNVLAIMFDMNSLWEKYIFWCLRKALPDVGHFSGYNIREQRKKEFWVLEGERPVSLKPDILLIPEKEQEKSIVIDTKWKANGSVSVEDLRQIYAYNHYFNAQKGVLLYPQKSNSTEKVTFQPGSYSEVDKLEQKYCSLMLVDLIDGGELNEGIGLDILEKLD